MSRVLLLDSSFAARPIHDWLLEQGFEVWTIGNRSQDVLARRDPARHLIENYADVAAVQAHVDRIGIDHVIPGCTDISIETALRLRVLGTRLDKVESYRHLADKAAFRTLCIALELPAPHRVAIDAFPMPGQFIAKPADSFSGRGISVFDGMDVDAAHRALQWAQLESRGGEALIETFVDGQLHSYSCFLEGQRVVDATIVREDGSVTPYAVDTSYVCPDFPLKGAASVRDSIERLARYLNLVDGLLHVQFIWDGVKPWLIELSRRCPGDLYTRLVELSTGNPLAARYASYFVGRQAPTAAPTLRHILRHTITAKHESYEGIWFNSSASVVEIHALFATGREAPLLGRIDRVALVFLELDSADALVTEHRRFLTRQAYHSRILY
ncbi:biotin carboxylase [Rhizobium sp. PP-F2F-G38]|nr:biotin carboxylase [Rhizobium sp. PP-F2F-G38]